MAIENEDILALKQTISLADVVRSRGVVLTQKGRQLWGLCPFHEDTEPSFAVDERKGLWNCLGKCNEGGDVLSFVMKADGIDFKAAFELLRGVEPQRRGDAEKKAETRAVASVPCSTDLPTKADAEYLEKAVAYYHGSLVKNEKAVAYLASRGITPEAVQVFRLGYVEGTLRGKLNADGKASLERLGLLNEKGNETMYGSVVFPLVDAAHGKPTGLYARHTGKDQHLYLAGKRRGLFNPSGAKGTGEVILTESVIDALALWSIGVRNVTCSYGVNGLTDEILEHLRESRVRRVVLMLDADEAGREASQKFAEKLSAMGIESRTVELPYKDASEFVANGGALEELQRLIEPPRRGDAEMSEPGAVATGLKTTDHRPLTTLPDGTRAITFDNREYRVRGLTAVGLERLKVNLRLNVGNLFHLDTLDLYQSRARANFAQTAAKMCRVNESVINADLLSLIESLEAERLEMRKEERSHIDTEAAMTDAEKRAALSFLKDENLCERIVEDFRRCGLVGERSTVLTAYLGAASRKLQEPLALLIVARSGAGKSALQDAICNFVPPEELVRVTRLTGQALFYKDPYSLQRKMLVIAEDEGAMQAVYSLRTLASDQRLSIAATRTDPNTGKLATEHYEVFGPVVIVITTTSAEAFDEETRSRFVQLSMNESIEQTRMILSQQRHQHSLSGVMEKAESEEIKRLHHNAQRMLKPLAVVNPFVEYLTYPSERLIHRREQRKYLSLINSIALLHQHQREIKTARRGEIEIEYVEVELSDIALANELAEEILGRAMDELAPPVRGMFDAISEACRTRADELKIKACDVQLTRREIREATGWSDWQVRMYCQRLVEMEYLWAIQSANGKPSVYQLAGETDGEVQNLRGLTSIDELKTRLTDAAKASAASR